MNQPGVAGGTARRYGLFKDSLPSSNAEIWGCDLYLVSELAIVVTVFGEIGSLPLDFADLNFP